MDGWLAGGATVPGLALIAVLPLVRQVFEVPLSWQSGRAAATGAHVPATTIRPATSAADFAGAVIVHFPSGATALVVPIVSVHTPPLREALSLPQTNNQSDEQLIRPPTARTTESSAAPARHTEPRNHRHIGRWCHRPRPGLDRHTAVSLTDGLGRRVLACRAGRGIRGAQPRRNGQAHQQCCRFGRTAHSVAHFPGVRRGR